MVGNDAGGKLVPHRFGDQVVVEFQPVAWLDPPVFHAIAPGSCAGACRHAD
jgi:hypothetical protein